MSGGMTARWSQGGGAAPAGRKPYRVVYIMGNGHSGSTLLDIVLGSQPGAFSAGELTFIGRPGLVDEYCSCGQRLGACPFWSDVRVAWGRCGAPDIQKYWALRRRFERNKVSLRTLAQRIRPSADYAAYVDATEALFDAIHEVSGAETIIDSSKTPARLAILSHFADVSVVHLCREFRGVLNSSQRKRSKDLAKGVEEDVSARRSSRVLSDWLATNALAEVFVRGHHGRRVHYRRLVAAPDETLAALEVAAPSSRTFSAPHMLAGNKLRLKRSISIDGNIGYSYDQLTGRQALIAACVDTIFPRWSGGGRLPRSS